MGPSVVSLAPAPASSVSSGHLSQVPWTGLRRYALASCRLLLAFLLGLSGEKAAFAQGSRDACRSDTRLIHLGTSPLTWIAWLDPTKNPHPSEACTASNLREASARVTSDRAELRRTAGYHLLAIAHRCLALYDRRSSETELAAQRADLPVWPRPSRLELRDWPQSLPRTWRRATIGPIFAAKAREVVEGPARPTPPSSPKGVKTRKGGPLTRP